ncbi:hypothetical protein PENTCL1PPCAC_5602, partial [Pristionchus entomophagus]
QRRTSTAAAAAAAPLLRPLQLDSESDEGGEKEDDRGERERNNAKPPTIISTPISASLSLNTRQFRRSTLRSRDSPKARKLDFSILDDVEGPPTPVTSRKDVSRTPSPSKLTGRGRFVICYNSP